MEQQTPVTGSVGMSVAAVTMPSGSEGQSSNTAELRLVYLATAADTSCVSHDDDSRQHTVVSVGDVSHHMIMDINGSDNDDDDDDDDDDASIEEAQHNMSDSYGNATVLQRN